MKTSIRVAIFSFIATILLVSFQLEKSKDNSGIEFSTLTFEQAKTKAKASNQLIFIDAYASWCGPCKKMAASSFKDAAVGEVFNNKFINLKVDCELDADGLEIARLYKVRAYPTLLIVDSQGNLKKKVVGFQSAERLIELANSIE
jgi:thiol:disulfide interchange protein